MNAPPGIVVVGAGLAGLAAAARLRACGADVRVIDPEPPGGKARTLTRDAWRYERGPHSFTHRADALFALAHDLGVADRVVKLGKIASARYLVRGGRLRKVGPFSGAIRLGEMWGVLRGLFRHLPIGVDETVREVLAARFGESFADGPGDAMLNGIWASSPAEVAMEAAFPALTAAIRAKGSVWAAVRSLPRGRPSGTYGFPEGLGVLGDAAQASLGERAFCACQAQRLEARGGGWLIETTAGEVHADAVVIATDATSAATLLAGVAPVAAERLREIRYAPLAVAHWLSADSALPHGFGWLAPHGENRGVLGTIFVSDVFPSRAPSGQRAFATMLGGTRRPEDAALDLQAVRGRIEVEHRELTGHAVTLSDLQVVRHARAVTVPGPGHVARVATIRGSLPAGLHVAGSWCGAGAMNDAVLAGQVAASELWRSCAPGSAHAT